MTTVLPKRDERIDVLRAIGLLCIILAHVDPPAFIYALRNFDVPMMVVLSGMSFTLSYKSGSYLNYLADRFFRLVLPVWIFLCIFFAVAFLAGKGFSAQKIIDTFLLLDGIGYVWIIRVFLLVAIAAPFMFFLRRKIGLGWFSIFLAVIYALHEAMVHLFGRAGNLSFVFGEIVFYLLPYAVVFSVGIIIYNAKKSRLVLLLLCFAAVFFALAVWYRMEYGYWVSNRNYKFPPTAYYFSYAMMVACFLWLFAERLVDFATILKIKSFLMFCGSNSIWIYLWHILFVSALKQSWYLKYPLVLILSVAAAGIQMYVVKVLVLPKFSNRMTAKRVKSILTG